MVPARGWMRAQAQAHKLRLLPSPHRRPMQACPISKSTIRTGPAETTRPLGGHLQGRMPLLLGECVEVNYTTADWTFTDQSFRNTIQNSYFSNSFSHTSGSYDSTNGFFLARRANSSSIISASAATSGASIRAWRCWQCVCLQLFHGAVRYGWRSSRLLDRSIV